MKKITIIGAGSIVFSTTVTNDILATDALSDSELILMDIDLAKAQRVENYVRRIADRNGLRAIVKSTTDRRAALTGADFVITTFLTRKKRSTSWHPGSITWPGS